MRVRVRACVPACLSACEGERRSTRFLACVLSDRKCLTEVIHGEFRCNRPRSRPRRRKERRGNIRTVEIGAREKKKEEEEERKRDRVALIRVGRRKLRMKSRMVDCARSISRFRGTLLLLLTLLAEVSRVRRRWWV